jgi:hypothetical protein
MDTANRTTIAVSTSPKEQQPIRHDMATTAARSLSVILHAAAATCRAITTSHLRPAGRFLQRASASACPATSAELPTASEHAAATEHSELPAKRHAKSVLANTDGSAADRYASAANAATDATATTATAAADGPSTDRHAPIPAAAATTATTTAAVRTATTTIPTQRAPIRQILHSRPLQLPSTRSPATAPVSPRRQRSRRATAAAANASSPAQRHDASERQHEPFPAAAAAGAATEHAHQRHQACEPREQRLPGFRWQWKTQP